MRPKLISLEITDYWITRIDTSHMLLYKGMTICAFVQGHPAFLCTYEQRSIVEHCGSH